jgi:exopolysaccharide biosynthesis protein
MSLVSDQVKAIYAQHGRPLAAVNGDFYKSSENYPGDPEGVQIFHGELVSAPRPTHSCFWVDAGGSPRITNVLSRFNLMLPNGTSSSFGLNEEREKDAVVLFTAANGSSTRARGGVELILTRGMSDEWLPLHVGVAFKARVKQVNKEGDSPLTAETMVLSAGPEVSAKFAGLKPGDEVKISTGTLPDMAGSQVAIGGGPALVRGGVALPFKGLQPRHPRTALGWNREHYFMVEVDGRQRVSAGMSFAELAAYMAKLGCTEAINLDGGGSATLWAFGNVMNNPSEGHERPAANGLVLVRKPAQD